MSDRKPTKKGDDDEKEKEKEREEESEQPRRREVALEWARGWLSFRPHEGASTRVAGTRRAEPAVTRLKLKNWLFYWDLLGRLGELVSLDRSPVNFSRLGLAVTCPIPEALARDPLFLALMQQRLNASRVELVERLAEIVVALIAAEEGTEPTQQDADTRYEAGLKLVTVACEAWGSKISTIVIAIVREQSAREVAYQRYIARATVNLVVAGASVVIAGSTVGAAVVSGAGIGAAVPAMFALIASTGSVITQVIMLSTEADQVALNIGRGLREIQDRYDLDVAGLAGGGGAGATRIVAANVGENVLEVLAALSGGTFGFISNSVAELVGMTDTLASKLDGMEIELHRASVLLGDTVEALQTLENELAALERMAAESGDPALTQQLVELDDGVTKVVGIYRVEDQLEKITNKLKQILALRRLQLQLSRDIRAMQAALKTKTTTDFVRFLAAGAMFYENFTVPGQALSVLDLESIEFVVETTVGLKDFLVGLAGGIKDLIARRRR